MASEQFSLCWDNFHKNMSSGMNSLLESEDLVDVTLAVEGKLLKAHKMVLSVCSPYFKELFKSNPCQHPIVFMKDVSYVAISDLLQFMYQGEVQVSQDNLTTFIKTAEALQIKGLTGDGNDSNNADPEPVLEKPSPRHVEEYKPSPRPKKQVPAPVVTTTPAPKRPRLSVSSNDSQSAPAPITKTEPVSAPASGSDSVQFKVEPYDQNQSVTIPDDNDDNFGDDTLDDNLADDNEDYSMMEGEEPQAGTSTDGTGEGQADLSLKSMESDDEVFTSPDTIDLSKIVELNSLPEKSRKLYEHTYKKFMEYLAEKKINSYSESVLMTYFVQLAENVKSSTLWSNYSMLKTTLMVNNNVDMSKYTNLKLFLKRKADGYRAKKSPVFDREHIEKFLTEAPDDKFLSTKVALIIGVAGACRNQELLQIKVNDIDDMTDKLLITLTDTVKTKRSFLLTEYLDIYRKYAAARPAAMDTQRFFYKYTDGKPHRHSIGIHKLGKMPHDIAQFLKMPNAKEFTGHCFRRTAASLSANSGGDVIMLKRCGGWQNLMDGEGFNTDCLNVKQEIDTDNYL